MKRYATLRLITLFLIQAHVHVSAVVHSTATSPSYTYAIPRPQPVGNLSPHLYASLRTTHSLPNHFSKRQSEQPTESSIATLTDPVAECTPYYLPEMKTIASSFPEVYKLASIVQEDTEANQAMKNLNASGWIPSGIPVRGTQPASVKGVALTTGYDAINDPDCWWTVTHCTTPKAKLQVETLAEDIITCPEPHTYGYTFDDGPNCSHNPLYDLWEANRQKASLMYIGSNVFGWPLEAQRGIVDGHHICVHTWSHPYMTALTNEQVFAELWYTMKIIKSVIGITPTCWRPPYGDVDDRVRAIAQALGLRTIMWDLDTDVWNLTPAGPLQSSQLSATFSSIQAQATVIGLTGGTIVLDHEIEENSMNFSMSQYKNTTDAWKYVVPVSVCLNITQPYVESEYVYPDFEQYIAGNVDPSGLPSGNISISAPIVLLNVSEPMVTASANSTGSVSNVTATVTTDSHPSSTTIYTSPPTTLPSEAAPVGATSAAVPPTRFASMAVFVMIFIGGLTLLMI